MDRHGVITHRRAAVLCYPFDGSRAVLRCTHATDFVRIARADRLHADNLVFRFVRSGCAPIRTAQRKTFGVARRGDAIDAVHVPQIVPRGRRPLIDHFAQLFGERLQ
jgi:hypothetical protein